MLTLKRREQLLSILHKEREVTLQDLVGRLNSSLATVRRDVTWLAEHKMLTRTHGGAMCRPNNPARAALEYFSSNQHDVDPGSRKRAIAAHASSLCQPDDVIIINSGSTTFLMTEFLAQSGLNILTNSFQLARQLLGATDNEVTLTSGRIYRDEDVILSPFTSDVPQHHYASKIFAGAYGIGEAGVMETDALLVQAERRLMGLAEELIVLADSSKFQRTAGMLVCPLGRVGTLITDTGISDSAARMIESAGITLITVEPYHGLLM